MSDDISPLKRAFLALQQTEARLEAATRGPIAVVGLGCRLPGGATSPDALWTLIRDAVDATSEIPADRWDVDAWYAPDRDTPDRMYTRRGGFLRDLAGFDAAFFGISPAEAAEMDPQQRLVLEVAWEALEDAGIAPLSLRGSRTGVWLGITTDEYALRTVWAGLHTVWSGTGSMRSIAGGRLSYLLGLHGPNVSVDTACSSSLVTTHQACQALRAGDCDLALSIGVNAILTPELNVHYCKLGLLAADGRCKTFDASADGYGRGEGCGVLVLERLDDAVRNGHRIHAVILGSDVNQDGTSAGLTAPSGTAQQDVVRRAIERAGVAPADVDWIEAHGTGTELGDPIEVTALAAVLGEGREHPLFLGSIKANVGHLEGAAGVAGMLRAILALEHDTIPPQRGFSRPNPHVPWSALPVAVPTQPLSWPRSERRRVVGVSSFGLSGTNAHVVLGEAPLPTPRAGQTRPAHLLPLSARDPAALLTLRDAWGAALDTAPLGDLAHTAAVGRAHHGHRVAIVASTVDEARQQLAAALPTAPPAEPPRVVFLFTGQGSQRLAMARELYAAEPVFREVIDRCDAVVRMIRGQALTDVLLTEDPRIDDTAWTQPGIVALELALAALWRSWGIEPVAVLGHSVGQIAAAAVAGVFTLEDAMRLVEGRGRLMSSLPNTGAMAAVFAAPEVIAPLLMQRKDMLDVAAINHPGETVISGHQDALNTVLVRLAEQGIESRRLTVSHAFHSPLMNPILPKLSEILHDVSYARPVLPLISDSTGQRAADEVLDPDHWVRHARGAIRFADALRALPRCDVLLELGPQPVLLGMAVRTLSSFEGGRVPRLVGTLRPGVPDTTAALGALRDLYLAGATVDFAEVQRGQSARLVRGPTYPWQHKRHWIERDAAPAREAVASTWQVDWEAAPEPGDVTVSGPWLVCADDGGVGDALPVDGVRVHAADAYSLSAGVATIDPRASEQWSKLVRAVAPKRAAYLWGLDEADPTALERALGGLLALARALPVSVPLGVVTRRVWGDGARGAAQGALWGLARTLALETGRPITLVDVDGADPEPARLLRSLTGPDDEVLLRAERRVARVVPAALPAGGVPAPGGTVLVTGGLGALGQHLVPWLAGKGVGGVLLASRRSGGEAAPVVAALRAHGVRVDFVSADVSTEAGVITALSAVPSERPLRGVIHAAGVLDDAPVRELTWARVRAVLAPKADGAWRLHEATRTLPLDWFVLFSSSAGFLGGPGQAAYAAANAFLDALATQRHAMGLPALSVGFGPWAGDGMAAGVSTPGLGRLSPEEALGALDRALAAGVAHVGVMRVTDAGALRARAAGVVPARLEALVGAPPPVDPSEGRAGAAARAPTGLAALPAGDRRAAAADIVLAQLRSVLALEGEPDPGRSLLELGLDSLMAVELRNRVNAAAGVDLPVATVLSGPSITGLVDAVLAALPPGAGSPGDAPVVAAEDVVPPALPDVANYLFAALAGVGATIGAWLVWGWFTG